MFRLSLLPSRSPGSHPTLEEGCEQCIGKLMKEQLLSRRIRNSFPSLWRISRKKNRTDFKPRRNSSQRLSKQHGFTKNQRLLPSKDFEEAISHLAEWEGRSTAKRTRTLHEAPRDHLELAARNYKPVCSQDFKCENRAKEQPTLSHKQSGL